MAATGLALALASAAPARRGGALAGTSAPGSAPGGLCVPLAMRSRVAMMPGRYGHLNYKQKKDKRRMDARRKIKRALGLYKGDEFQKGPLYEASLVDSIAKSIARAPPIKIGWPDIDNAPTIEPYLEEDKAILEEGEDEDEDEVDGEVEEDDDDFVEEYDPWEEVFSDDYSKKSVKSLRKMLRKQKHVDGSVVDPEIRQTSIRKANFLSQCPSERADKPEFAVFGISNSGKSSFINMLVDRNKLLDTSKTPGKTKQIWHINCDRKWYLVDLPGIGYAELSLGKMKAMDSLIASYVEHRTTLVRLLYLVDISTPLRNLDVESIKWLSEAGAHLTIIFTKCDAAHRIGRDFPGGASEELETALLEMQGSPWRLGHIEDVPPMFMCSAKSKDGREAVLEHIADWRARAVPRFLKGRKQRRERRKARMESVAPAGIR